MTAYSALWLRGARRLRPGHGALVREPPRAPQRAESGGEEHHILPVTHSKFSLRLLGSTSYSHKYISRKTPNERPVSMTYNLILIMALTLMNVCISAMSRLRSSSDAASWPPLCSSSSISPSSKRFEIQLQKVVTVWRRLAL